MCGERHRNETIRTQLESLKRETQLLKVSKLKHCEFVAPEPIVDVKEGDRKREYVEEVAGYRVTRLRNF